MDDKLVEEIEKTIEQYFPPGSLIGSSGRIIAKEILSKVQSYYAHLTLEEELLTDGEIESIALTLAEIEEIGEQAKIGLAPNDHEEYQANFAYLESAKLKTKTAKRQLSKSHQVNNAKLAAKLADKELREKIIDIQKSHANALLWAAENADQIIALFQARILGEEKK